MDTELARTFLAIVERGSFVAAAERLHLTQSTVSARIRGLERDLGCRLFERNRSGATLTSAGARFRRHALLLVRTVDHARAEVGTAAGFADSLTLGGRFGLWQDLMLHWLGALRAAAPALAVRAEIGFEADLNEGLGTGRVDVAVMYTPQFRAGLEVEHLFSEQLVCVATRPDTQAPGPDYVQVDWGPEFLARYHARFADAPAPALSVNIGWLGLQHMLAAGGSGYFPVRLVASLLDSGRLHAVDAPAFELPAWVVYPAGAQAAVRAVGVLRDVVAARLGAGTASQASMSSNNTLDR